MKKNLKLFLRFAAKDILFLLILYTRYASMAKTLSEAEQNKA